MSESRSMDSPGNEKGPRALSRPDTGATPTAREQPESSQRTAELANLEAVLFVGREPLTSRKIADLAGLANGPEARKLIHRLNGLYDVGGAPVRVEEVAGGHQLLTRPKFGPWLRRLLQRPVETRLSAPAMETLAVVAYRQPVLRTEIESVRGVQCGDILRQLMERDLVRIVGRSDDLGRPLLYGTTKRFLALFGLRHLDELPRAAEFRVAEVGGSGGGQEASPDDRIPEDESVTTRIRPASGPEEELDEPIVALKEAARRQAKPKPIAAADEEEDEDDLDDDEDDEWEDDEDEDEDEDEELEDEEDDDFVDEEWEEVDDEEPEEDDDDEEDDEEWDEEDEDEEDWDEDDEEDEDEDEEWEDEAE